MAVRVAFVTMSHRGDSRREYITLLAIEPADGTLSCEVQISFERMQAVGRRSMGHAKECGFIVPMVLQKPTAIFEGLRRDEDEARRGFGWRCYCGVPEQSFRPDGTPDRPYLGQVYLVFVNDERVAYNWRWEKADPDDPKLPINHQNRFKQRLL
jgi:hypothetical protein